MEHSHLQVSFPYALMDILTIFFVVLSGATQLNPIASTPFKQTLLQIE